jgi:hypothetical protein
MIRPYAGFRLNRRRRFAPRPAGVSLPRQCADPVEAGGDSVPRSPDISVKYDNL